MKNLTFVALLVCALLAPACGSQEPAVEQPTPAPEAATTPPAEPVQPEAATPPAEAAAPAETPAAEATPPAEAALSVSVEGLTKGQSGPSKGKLEISAVPDGNAIVVSLANYSHYCSPEPTFTVAARTDSLEISAVKPTGALSRCFAPHAMKLRVAIPARNNMRTVVLLGADGKQLGSATIGAK